MDTKPIDSAELTASAPAPLLSRTAERSRRVRDSRRHGSTVRGWELRAILLGFALTFCSGDASDAGGDALAARRQHESERIRTLAAAPRPAVDSLPASPTAAEIFSAATSGRPDAPEVVSRVVAPDAPAELVAAAALGLGVTGSPNTPALLVAYALGPRRPPEALEALFSYYRWKRGAAAPATLPDPRLLDFATHPSVRGRAALLHLGRVVLDPRLVPLAEKLADDPDFEVRRAAALAAAGGPDTSPRSEADNDRCIRILTKLCRDADGHVAAAACRALGTHDTSRAGELLESMLGHPDFNVRVAAIESLGRRKIAHAVPALLRIARADTSPSVQYAAGTQLAQLDPAAARDLVDEFLASRSPYVRTAACEILARSTDASAAEMRLDQVAHIDPQVRVREAAVSAFSGKAGSLTGKLVIRRALSDGDPGVAAAACSVAEANGWIDFSAMIEAVPARFSGAAGADARGACVSALAKLSPADHRALFTSLMADPSPIVRAAADKALSGFGGREPAADHRGADLSGDLLPGGAPLFGRMPVLVLDTDAGTIRIRLYPDLAPIHCAHVAALARKGFYDGLTWHRVVPDFVIQGGCPRGDGSGGAGVSLPLEPTMIPFERGTLGMPRAAEPDTGGCQLFICHSRAPHLDVNYTAFGRVVVGIDVVDRIDVDMRIIRARVEDAE